MKKAITLFGCFYSMISQAQEKSSAFSAEAGVIMNTTAAYSINNTDTSYKNQFTVAHYVRIMHESGLGVSYSLHTLLSGNEHLFMHTASAFYEQYDKPINLNFRYTHFFFTGNTAIPYTPISNELYGFVADKKLWLAPAMAASLGFGNDENKQLHSSLNLAAGVMHSFTFGNKTITDGELSPSLFVNVGNNEFYSFLETTRYITQNSSSNGFIKSRGRGRGRSNSGNGGTTTTTETAVTASRFAVNNIELNLYSNFSFHHFEITPDASVFAPVHSSDGFSSYWQLKLGYNF